MYEDSSEGLSGMGVLGINLVSARIFIKHVFCAHLSSKVQSIISVLFSTVFPMSSKCLMNIFLINKILENMDSVYGGVGKKCRERTIHYTPAMFQALCSHLPHVISFTRVL